MIRQMDIYLYLSTLTHYLPTHPSTSLLAPQLQFNPTQPFLTFANNMSTQSLPPASSITQSFCNPSSPFGRANIPGVTVPSALLAASTSSAVGSSGRSTMTLGSLEREAMMAARFCMYHHTLVYSYHIHIQNKKKERQEGNDGGEGTGMVDLGGLGCKRTSLLLLPTPLSPTSPKNSSAMSSSSSRPGATTPATPASLSPSFNPSPSPVARRLISSGLVGIPSSSTGAFSLIAGVDVSMKGVVVDMTPADEACWKVVVRETGDIGLDDAEAEGGAVGSTVGGEMGGGWVVVILGISRAGDVGFCEWISFFW